MKTKNVTKDRAQQWTMALVTCSNRHKLRVKGSPVGSEKLPCPGALCVHLTPLAAQTPRRKSRNLICAFFTEQSSVELWRSSLKIYTSRTLENKDPLSLSPLLLPPFMQKPPRLISVPGKLTSGKHTRCEGGMVWMEGRALYAWVMGTQARRLRELKVHSTCGQNALMQINTCDWSIKTEDFLYFQVTPSKSPVYNFLCRWHSKDKSVTAAARNSTANHYFIHQDLSYFTWYVL